MNKRIKFYVTLVLLVCVICGCSEQQLISDSNLKLPEGLGIGLSISRSIIESHKGQIWATENHDGGTKFKFTLPIAYAAATL